MNRLHLFILLFAASSLLFQFPPGAFAVNDISATDSATDGENGFTELDGAFGVDTFTIGSSTYAIVASEDDNGVQIIDISDPNNIVAKDAETDEENGFDVFDGATDVDTFVIGSSTYAIVAAYEYGGFQIIDISDPENIVAKVSVNDDDEDENGDDLEVLDGAIGVDTFVIDSSTYAIVAAYSDNGVQVIDISDPTKIYTADATLDGENGFTYLRQPTDVDTFVIGSSTYAIVTSRGDSGVQIIDISDPNNIVAKDAETDGENGFTILNQARAVDVFTIDSSTYAIVASEADNGVQIIDISDVDNIVAKGTMGDTDSLELDGAFGVDTFVIDSSTYAIVAAYSDNGVQVIDISDVDNIVATDAETDGENSFTELDGAQRVATFVIDSSTYAIVTAKTDDGVQIIGISTASDASTASTASTGNTCARLVILGNCGTIAINNNEYQIIDPWSTVPTTEVMVGEPVSITLSTPHNYVAGKINSASVYTEIFGSAANYEESTHIYYTMNDDIIISDHATEKQLFQIAGATHRIVQDTDVKNLELFEVVFTMVFAKPMDMSYIVVEIKNMHGISETIYLRNALKVIEIPIELLTYEEKSKFELIFEPELKDSLRPDMDIEPNVDVLAIDPEPVSKVTCGNGTILKDNLCVVDETSFYLFFSQFMRFFG